MIDLNFNEYQKRAIATDKFGGGKHDVNEAAFLEKILGLCGEAGEVSDKIKKIIRDKNGKIEENDKVEIIKELGDVLWYDALIAEYLGFDFASVAQANLDKLSSRKSRGKISGSGDNR